MRYAIPTLLAVLALTATCEPLIMVEVTFLGDGRKETGYFNLVQPALDLRPPPWAGRVIVRVDSSSPLKPRAVAGPGVRVVELGYDHLVAGLGPDHASPEIKVLFANSSSIQPFAYLLVMGDKVRLTGRSVNMSTIDGMLPWGALLSAFLPYCDPGLVEGRAQLISCEQKLLNSSLGGVRVWENLFVVYSPVFRLRNHTVLFAEYVPIYCKKLKVEGQLAIAEEPTPRGEVYLYVNKPAYMDARLLVPTLEAGVLSKIYSTTNPLLVRIPGGYQGPLLSLSLHEVRVRVPKGRGFLMNVMGDGGSSTFRGGGPVVPSLTRPLVINVTTRDGDIVASYEVLSYAPEIEVPLRLHSMYVRVEDFRGEPLSNVTLMLYKGLKLVGSGYLTAGEGCFENLPSGEYTLRVVYKGREVARKRVFLRADRSLRIVCNVSDLLLSVVRPDGQPIEHFKVFLSGVGGEVAAEGRNGTAVVRGLGFGEYNITVTAGWSNSSLTLKFEGQPELRIVLPLYSLRVKVVDVVGNPVVGALVKVEDGSGRVLRRMTGVSGDAGFDALPPGRYIIHVEYGGERGSLTVNLDGRDRFVKLHLSVLAVGGIALGQVHALIVLGTIAVMAVLAAVRRRRGEEVLEL